MNHIAINLKLTHHCKSTILQLKKKGCEWWQLKCCPKGIDNIHYYGNIHNGILFLLVFTFYFFKPVFFMVYSQLANVIVSSENWRYPAIHTHVSILSQTPLPYRLPHNIEESSLCYTVGPCWLSILNMVVWACPPQTL